LRHRLYNFSEIQFVFFAFFGYYSLKRKRLREVSPSGDEMMKKASLLILPAEKKDKGSSLRISHIANALADLATANIWILEGTIGECNSQLKVLFAGSKTQKHFIARQSFSNLGTESFLGKKNVFQLLLLLRNNRALCDLAIIEGDIFHRLVYKRRTDFFIPIWLQSRANIPLKAITHSAKDDLRRIRSNNLTYILTTDLDCYRDFYNNMYLPYVRMRHQESTIAMSYDVMMQKARDGLCDLILIMKENSAIAGFLILKEKKIPRLWSNGLRNGDLAYWKEGAIAATYHFASDHLAQQGYKEMHLGLMRSFFNDGIFQYKKKWGIHLATDSSAGFILKPLRDSDGLNRFFLNNPFIYCHKNRLCGAVFTRSGTMPADKEAAQLNEAYAISGLAELVLFYLNEPSNL
jgi:hypothetical protein